jgi:ribosomal protein S18 acetylase RimI-like enzyme
MDRLAHLSPVSRGTTNLTLNAALQPVLEFTNQSTPPAVNARLASRLPPRHHCSAPPCRSWDVRNDGAVWPVDTAAVSDVYRRVSHADDHANLLVYPEHLILGPDGLNEARTQVAEENGSVVGFATWADAAGVSELEDLFVDPDCRRQGIAAALVREIVDILRARGVERLEVTANPHAMGFYTASGFIHCGVAGTEFGEAPRMVLAIH